MKKYLIFIMIMMCTIFVGCTNQSFKPVSFSDTATFKTLSNVIYPDYSKEINAETIKSIDNTYINIFNEFTLKTTKELFTDDNNYIYSPISLYIALSMLLEGCDGNSYTELANLLKVSNLENNRLSLNAVYYNNYYYNNSGKAKIANSLWIKNGFDVNKTYIDNLSTNYMSEIYNTDFDDVGNENICKWVNHYTENMLNIKPEDLSLDNSLALLLLNTIYFKNKWKTEFKESNTTDEIFHTTNEKITTSFMNHVATVPYVNTKEYTSVTDYFLNGNSITYYLPADGFTVQNLLQDDLINLSQANKQQILSVRISVPKFKYTSDYDLNDKLMNLGVNDIFGPSADLSKISSGLYVGFVKQSAGIEVNEEGAEAAAVTSIGLKESAQEPVEPIYFTLDHPFIYIIRDMQNVPLFIGLVSNPKNN